MRNLKQIMASWTLAALLLLSNTSHALLAKEFFDLSTDEKNGYLIGALEMLAYVQFESDNPEFGQCMYDWFDREDTTGEIWHYAEKYLDKSVEGIILILARNACSGHAN